jgi:hypothetical protein
VAADRSRQVVGNGAFCLHATGNCRNTDPRNYKLDRFSVGRDCTWKSRVHLVHWRHGHPGRRDRWRAGMAHSQLAGVSVAGGGSGNTPILAVADPGGYELINIQVPWDAAGFNAVAVIQGPDRTTAVVAGGSQWPVLRTGVDLHIQHQRDTSNRALDANQRFPPLPRRDGLFT